MKRRNFLSLVGLGGFGFAIASQVILDRSGNAVTPASSLPLLRFAVLGDVGTGNKGQHRVAQAMESYYKINPFSFSLLTGDNIYESGEISKVGGAFEYPYRFFRRNSIPFYAVLGNHDIKTNNGEDQVKYSGYNMQGRYYTFTKETAQFFALDTNKNASWEEQLAWLEESLAKSQAQWKFVFGHHPVYSSGVHGSTKRLIAKLPPLFARYGVQLYFNGHDHNYERTQPIAGTTYLTSGAGAKLRPVGKSDWTARSVAKLSFAIVEVYADRLEIIGIGTNERIFDHGVIT